MPPARCLGVLGLLIATCAPAAAHPHVWITARSEVVFDGDRRLTGFRHTWTFDAAYSAFAVQGFDTKHDGRPAPDKLAELAKTNVESLEEWNWFTSAKVNGAEAELAMPTEYDQSFQDGRLTLRFLVPLKAPVPAPKVLVLSVDDPSFFVAFNMAADEGAVTLAGPARGCALSVRRPPKPAEEGVQILADEIANALSGRLDPATLGGDFTTRVLVACP